MSAGLAIPLVAWATVVAAMRPANDTRYAVRQFRPGQVGDVYDLDVTSVRHQHDVRTVRGQPPTVRDYDWTIHLAGRCTVRDVDGRGARVAVRCQVSVAVSTVDGRTGNFLPAGFVFDGTGKPGGTAYAGVSGRLPPVAERALRLVCPVYAPGEPTPDDVYPPGPKRAVGESWPMVPEQYRAAERAAGRPVPGTASGHATLRGPATVAGAPCLRVEYARELDGMTPATRPADVSSAAEHATSRATVALPLNGTEMAIDSDAVAAIDIVGRGTTADGTPFDETVRFDVATHATSAPVHP